MKKWFKKWIANIVTTVIDEMNKGSNSNTVMSPSHDSRLDENYLFDFKNYSADFGHGTFSVNVTGGSTLMVPSSASVDVDDVPISGTFITPVTPEQESAIKSDKFTGKIKIKPIDVLKELELIPTPFSLMGLDEKIAILKDKEALIRQEYSKREITALIERLRNRHRYNEFKSYFDTFQNTTEQAIDTLLAKYELVMKQSDIFIPEFPDEAVERMKSYTDFVMKICGKKPVFYVIAEENLFRKAFEKRDPILLVQSPFGFYWQILGAWDKEMLILHEL